MDNYEQITASFTRRYKGREILRVPDVAKAGATALLSP